jgi:hypothetical protein
MAARLEVAIGVLELRLRFREFGRDVCHPSQKQAVLGIVRGVGDPTQGTDRAGNIPSAGKAHGSGTFGRDIHDHAAILAGFDRHAPYALDA